jgi:hypothetical protein
MGTIVSLLINLNDGDGGAQVDSEGVISALYTQSLCPTVRAPYQPAPCARGQLYMRLTFQVILARISKLRLLGPQYLARGCSAVLGYHQTVPDQPIHANGFA